MLTISNFDFNWKSQRRKHFPHEFLLIACVRGVFDVKYFSLENKYDLFLPLIWYNTHLLILNVRAIDFNSKFTTFYIIVAQWNNIKWTNIEN